MKMQGPVLKNTSLIDFPNLLEHTALYRCFTIKKKMFGDLTRWAVHKIIGMKNEDTQSHILKCPVINAGKNPTESEYRAFLWFIEFDLKTL